MPQLTRRHMVHAIAVSFVTSPGCLVRDDGADSNSTRKNQQAETDDGVRIVLTQQSRATQVSKRIRITAEGMLEYDVTCGDDQERTTKTQIPTDEYNSLASIVRNANLETMADEYECQGSCPTDIPGWRYQFTVDSTTKSVSVEANAHEIPETLETIREHVVAIINATTTPTCDS